MAEELRKTGIGIVGSIPWGTHFCNFYETKEDLFDILIPYFKTGLENNEFCMWVIFPPHGKEEAKEALRRTIPGLDQRLADGDIEILGHKDWYLKGGTFDLQRVIDGWLEKLRQALAKGYAGMRANGNEAWLTKEDWKNFSAYEERLNSLIADQRMIVLCTYPLDLVRAAELFDVARTHEFAIAKRRGNWEVVESPEVKQAWVEMKRLNEELEQRIIDRTNELTASNQTLIREVSERKRSEEVVRESETRYRKLFESSHDIILFSDRAGNILDINLRAEQLTGYSQSNMRKMNIFQHLIVQEDQAIMRQVIRDLFDGRSRTYEERWRTRDGKIIYLDGLSVPQISQNGEVLSTLCTLRDITERKRAEEELRASEAKFRALSEHAPAAIFIYQGDKIRYANPAVEVIMGYSRQELLEMNFWDTAHPDFRDLVRERALARQRGEPVPLRYEFKIVTKAGEERWLDFTDGTFEFDGKLAVVGLCFDITERKRAEKAVRESQQLLDLVLATLPVGVAVTNRAGDIVLVNETSKRIWGGMIVSGRERWAQTKGFWHDSGKRIAPTNWASVRALSEGQTSLNELIDIETYDGRQKTILNSSAPIRNAEGLIVGTVIVNEDVTERVRAEEALRTSTEKLRAFTAKLESVRDEEGRHIGRELHDEIGSAMTGLRWDLEGLDKLCSEASGQIVCSTLRERINGMLGVIDSTSSTVQKISSELRPAILDDLGLIPAIEWQAQQFAVRTGIACQFDSFVESIDMDREKATAVFRMVQEALTNILRHSQATRVNIIIEKEDDELIVEVKDNGRGITELEKAGPSSLGLIGMQERTHLIKGRIEITGFPKKGTVITLRVPISNQNSRLKQ